LAIGKIQIPNPQAQAFDQTQTKAVEQLGDELLGARQGSDDDLDLFFGQNSRQAFGFFGTDGVDRAEVDFEHLAIEKQERSKGLVLRGCSDILGHGEMGEKSSNFGRAHFPGMALVVKEDIAFDPRGVGLLAADGVGLAPTGNV